jgi:hypothetical protein
MTRVAILPVAGDGGNQASSAISGERHSEGRTAGEALNALSGQLAPDESGTVVILQNFRPDCFFTAEQQARLHELMGRWRIARDTGGALDSAEQTELDALINAELLASGARAAAIADELCL